MTTADVVTFRIGIALGAVVGGILVGSIAATAPLVAGMTVALVGGLLLTSLRLRSVVS